MSSRARVVPAAAVAVGAVTIGLALWTATGQADSSTRTIEQAIGEIRLDAADADVTVLRGGATTRIRQEVHYLLPGGGDVRGFDVQGEALVLRDRCGWGCSIDYVVTVPDAVRVTGDGGSGDVVARDVAGVDVTTSSGDVELAEVRDRVEVQTSSGDVEVEGLRTGPVRLQTSSGDIEASGLRAGPLQLRSSSGDIEVDVAAPMSVTARASSGDVELGVPEAGYQVRAETSSGETEVEVPRDAGSDHVLDLTTSSGDVEVHTAS